MPLRDGTGPLGQGPMTGRGLGRGAGVGVGVGRNRQPNGFGMGPGGNCVCVNPKCKEKAPHQRGVPCYEMKCVKCGGVMTRER